MLKNNQRIKMAVRLMTTLVSKNVLDRDRQNDSDLFKLYDNVETLDGLVNVIVTGKIENKVKMGMVDGKEGRLWTKPDSILNVIDFNLLDDGINYKYPLFKNELTQNFAKRVYGEVSFYRDTVVADMRELRSKVNEMISETNTTDYTEFFNIELIDDKSIYNEFLDKEYFFNRMRNDIQIDLNSPMGIFINNIEQTLRNIKDSELAIVVDSALNEKIDKDKLFNKLNSLLNSPLTNIYNLKIENIDTIFWLMVLLENYLKNESNLNTLTNKIVSNVLQILLGNFEFLLTNLKNNIRNKVVAISCTKDSDNEMNIVVIRKNLIELSKEDDYNINAIYGLYSDLFFDKETRINTSLTKIDYLRDKKQVLYENFDRGMKLYNMEAKNVSIGKIRGMYMLLFNGVLDKYQTYSTYETREELSNAITNYIRITNLGELLDTYNMVENVIKKFLTNKTNYAIFEEAMDTATKVMGDDISVNEASVYATIELISEYFVGQLTIK